MLSPPPLPIQSSFVRFINTVKERLKIPFAPTHVYIATMSILEGIFLRHLNGWRLLLQGEIVSIGALVKIGSVKLL